MKLPVLPALDPAGVEEIRALSEKFSEAAIAIALFGSTPNGANKLRPRAVFERQMFKSAPANGKESRRLVYPSDLGNKALHLARM